MSNLLKRIPLHPFLIAIYPILYLLSINIEEVQPLAALRTMLIPLITSLIIFLLLWLILRNATKTGLIASFWMICIFILFFFIYAPVYLAIEKVRILGINVGRHRNLIILLILLLSASSWFIAKKVKDTLNITMILNIVAVVMVLFPIGQIVIFKIRSANPSLMTPQVSLQENTLHLSTSQPPPDIYYIILDMYTRDDVLKDFFGHDNLPFEQDLEKKGFYIAHCSQSNYHTTWLSVTSSLNMSYLQDLGLTVDTPMAPYLQHSIVRKALEKMGYSTVAFETGYSVTEVTDAKYYLAPFSSPIAALTYGGINPFEAMILSHSAGILVYKTLPNMSWQTQTFFNTPYTQYREHTLFILDRLDKLAQQIPGPKFVFAHILAPHDPFVFDQDGNYVFRYKPFTLNGDKEYDDEHYVVAYSAELTYLNKRVEEVVDNILANSKTPPVIILQGDHGAPRTNKIGANFAIFNAYYLPDNGAKKLYPSISPVNTFRVVFNTYFNGQYPLLPDISYDHNTDTNQFSQATNLVQCPTSDATK